MKDSNNYISETLFILFYGKLKHGHKINVAREIANNSESQMLHVAKKGQKMIKYCHLFLGFYTQALAEGKRVVIQIVDLEEEQSKKLVPTPVKAAGVKRKMKAKEKEEPPTKKLLLIAKVEVPEEAKAQAALSALSRRRPSPILAAKEDW